MSALESVEPDYRIDVLRADFDRDLRIALQHRRAANTRAMWAREAERMGQLEAYRKLRDAAKECRRRARAWLKGARWKRDEINWIELRHV